MEIIIYYTLIYLILGIKKEKFCSIREDVSYSRNE